MIRPNQDHALPPKTWNCTIIAPGTKSDDKLPGEQLKNDKVEGSVLKDFKADIQRFKK